MGIRLLIVEDNRIMRQTLRRLLLRDPELQIVGEADNGKTAVALALQLLPDVVLMDVSLPGINGIEATRRIVAAGVPVNILILTAHGDAALVREAQSVGATAYLLKNRCAHELPRAIRAIVGKDLAYIQALTDALLASICVGEISPSPITCPSSTGGSDLSFSTHRLSVPNPAVPSFQ